ncbi:MAG: helix-turn-helix transcriptional regulator [Clostridia bacterium]|nr:helix-turn-helix transcriptional regulator [Clostridia bacterium]
MSIYLKYDSPVKFLDGAKLSVYNEWAHLPVSNTNYTMIYVTKGTLFLQSADKRYEVSPGHILFIPPETVYGSYKLSKAPVTFYWCKFTLSETGIGTKYRLKNLVNASSSYVTNPIIKEIFSNAQSGASEEYLSFLLLTLLYSFTNGSNKIEKHTKDNFKKILSYIDENISSSLSASDIANHFGYNSAYFSRLFMKKTGVSPMEYIKRQRIFMAKELLMRPYDSVRDIGVACGYTDEKYFARLFKKAEGITPTQYRNLYGKQE